MYIYAYNKLRETGILLWGDKNTNYCLDYHAIESQNQVRRTASKFHKGKMSNSDTNIYIHTYT